MLQLCHNCGDGLKEVDYNFVDPEVLIIIGPQITNIFTVHTLTAIICTSTHYDTAKLSCKKTNETDLLGETTCTVVWKVHTM